MSAINKHFPTEELLDLIEGKQAPDSRIGIKAHLKSCTKCKTESDELSKIFTLMNSDESKDVAADSLVWAKNLFRTRSAKPGTSLVRKIFAALKLDLSLGQPAFAERSAAPAGRQMLYEADGNTLDLRVTSSDGSNVLSGQILGEDFSGCEAQLKLGRKFFSSTVNEINEFRFSGLKSGKYMMTVRNDQVELVLEDLEF